ncbi:GntR family transcriptional regulator [Bacillus sp. DTU_2020_1000418_1_SI_GHA_SEK_038]|uniref:GntR family transcriptional regulator n=1 Tax=Bacillus sp. DTU_2020_1000418_1_SI_GHA_SEK_038 TaxID=3077585 RepID=UPI0028E5DD90|nr:GntR family transcriptional regulator [Bacillus sp. DTU_2020_1000418_1_SI_GHA_SEK_038]WNS75785.1 GntR family transcriptional regulator [Bacillus sp. DTU_2020_1000418_1_SI_GHA_SEK_038]
MSILTTSITAQVTNAIRDAIVTGEYEPGKKLSEAALSEQYAISRTPIREALKQLEREGLVEIIPRVGTCVSKPTEKELTELFTVKEVLEGLAAGLLAESGNEEMIKEVEKAVAEMEKAVQTSDHKLYVESNNLFHKAILEGSDNSKLDYSLNLLLNQIPYSRYVYLSIEVPNRLEKSLQEHQAVLAAILRGDREEAEKAMREHVRASGLQLKAGIAKKLYEKNK